MTDLEAVGLNECPGVDGNSVGTLEHMDVDLFESALNTIENVVETTNLDKEHSNNVDNLEDISPDDSNDIDEPFEVNKVQKKRHILIDSDAEDKQHKNLDIGDKVNDKEQSTQIKVQKKRITLLADSDSEDEQSVINKQIIENLDAEDSEKENDKLQNKQVQKKKSRLVKMYDSDSNDNTVFGSQIKVNDEIDHIQSFRLKMLCDSESSTDETEQNDNQHGSKANEYEENLKIKLKPRKTKKNSVLEDKKMTGKEALEQRRQIKSESQRMVRESRVSLPYHRPKSHTLQEFLQRRSRVGDVITVPPNTPTTFAIKMSSEQLAFTAKRLAERENEIEKFYKSDTDSELEEEVKEVENKTDSEKPGNNETSHSDENKYISTVPKDSEPSSNSVVHSNTENSVEKVDKDNSVNKYETDQIVNLEESNNSQETDTTQTVNQKDMLTEEICEKQDEVTKLVEESNKRQDFDDDAATEEKIKELYNVLEKFINNGIHSKIKNNISDNTKDENVKMDDTAKENITTEDSISNINQTDNPKSEKKLLEEKKAAEMKLEQKLKKLNPLVSLKTNFQPRLSGGPNELVVLDDGIEKSKGVNDLMKRFLVHTAKKTVHKKTDVSIVNVEGGVIHQETINLVDDEKEEHAKVTQTPGAKFKKLREELEEQMARKREEEWKKRQEQKRLDNEEDIVYNEEKTECGMAESAILFDEEEEMTESESSEDEEDDVEIKEKPRTKSAFVDDEAEQSDDVADEEDDDEEDDSDEEDDNEEQVDEVKDGVKKPLKRIITVFNDDSDEDEDKNNTESQADLQRTTNASTTTNVFASQAGKQDWDDNDDEITLYQPQNNLEKTPNRNLTQTQNKPDLSFLTPTLHLTGLQGMPSTSNLQESPVISLSLPPEPSPLRSHPGLKTKLFDDTEPSDFNSNLDELEGLCSGKFTDRDISELRNNKNLTTEEAELLAVCSGRFTGLTGHVSSEPRSTEENKHSSFGIDLWNDDSQEIKLTFDDDDIMKATKTQDTSNQTLTIETEKDIEERNIEEVSEKKLTEIIQESCSETKCELASKPIKETSSRPKFVIASSSDEEIKEDVSSLKKKKLKKKRKKYIIDDISITDDDDFEDREDDFEDNEEEHEDIDTRNVGYDSEENEIDLDEIEKEDNVVNMKKARDFFDAEAELSGSDWGSADEDEKDLDDFEIEEGDMEKINEKKMQQELGKIHARQLLDDDKREVRLLQELLLEDGEMHGTGRERKFRWKNADTMVWNTDDKPKDDDEDCEEIESEFQWRKMRHEREMFLKEQQLKINKTDIDDFNSLANDSQIMKFGHAALKKTISGVESQHKLLLGRAKDVTKSPDVKLPFALVNKRGSFLARSETTLARLAELTQTTNGVLNNGPRQSRNFVFTAVEKPETIIGNTKKRKAEEGTPKILKKLRIADMSPNVSKLKKKFPQKLNMQ
ncbi:claspin [Carabus blaptoides fortunei]